MSLFKEVFKPINEESTKTMINDIAFWVGAFIVGIMTFTHILVAITD